MMLMSAVTSFATVYYTGNLFLGILIAMLVGGVLAAIHAFLSITMRANQVVSGLCITLFGSGMATFLGQKLGPESNSSYLVGLVGNKFEPAASPSSGLFSTRMSSPILFIYWCRFPGITYSKPATA